MRRAWPGAVVLSALVPAACDPRYAITGRVLRKDGSPVAGASVDVRCPDPKFVPLHGHLETSADGSFVFGGLGCLRRACFLEVAGAAPAAIENACTERSSFMLCGWSFCDQVEHGFTLPVDRSP